MDLDINHSLEILKEEDEEKDRRYRIVAVAVDKGDNSEYVVHWALNHLVKFGSYTCATTNSNHSNSKYDIFFLL